MFEIHIHQKERFKFVEPHGRIDGLSAPELQTEFEKLTSLGAREIIVSFKSISYISSAGLRIFLSLQKTLKKIGGELILVCVAPSIRAVFDISGFASIFRIYDNEDEIPEILQGDKIRYEVMDRIIQGVKLHMIAAVVNDGALNIIGSMEKLGTSDYTESDVIEVNASDIQYGTGLAVLGDEYSECKDLFGETVIIDRNFFTYPALKKSAVDYMLSGQINSALKFKFFHGYKFSGEPSIIFQFNETDDFISLSSLVKISAELTYKNVYGIVVLAESGGIYGMNLKKTPLRENKPAAGGIFEQKNFPDWMDFPLEAAASNHIIAATGVAVKDRSCLSDKYNQIFSEDSLFHIHGVIFEKGLLSKDILNFDNELKRIVSELQPLRVQHLLGKSIFKNGMLAIIDLEEY